MRLNGVRITTIFGAALAALAFAAPAAQADHHIMQIREIFPGSTVGGNANEYIELEMLADGQNLTSGHQLQICTAVGGCNPFPLAGPNPAVAQTHRTVLIGGISFGATFPTVTPDYPALLLNSLDPAGGAVCFGEALEPVDCVSWGAFPPATALISAAGTPAPVIPDGASLERSTCRGTPNVLDAADDTNNSTADFFINASPVPTPNSSAPIAATGCPDATPPETTISKGPKKKIRTNKATFKFSSSEPGSTFQCALDKKAFKACTSPKKVTKLKKGKHKFQIQAIDPVGNVDGSPAVKTFKVVE
ncbi:MAG: hypothetical protein QOG62_1173 [Thermoleophilaceae bacterium]|jgi:hypothetical protein|nr:hypothetical protein [Thermoleophilaceae bacterium]